MIKLLAVEPKVGTKLLLRFPDGAWGICDFARYLEANTEMTAPLRDAQFFSRHFIEAGAPAWPNGFDLSAGEAARGWRIAPKRSCGLTTHCRTEMHLQDGASPVLIAAHAGVAYEPERSADPIADWVSLMEVVEALCPRWPEREPSMGTRFEF